MEIPSIHSTQLYSQAAHQRRPGIKQTQTEPQKSASIIVNISDKAENRWRALESLNAILELNQTTAPVLSLHSAQALGKMMQTLSKRGIIGLESGKVGDEAGTRYAATVIGIGT